MERKLKLEESYIVERAGVELLVDLGSIPHGILAQLIYHGLTQKIGDAAAGAVRTAYEATKAEDAPSWENLTSEAKRDFKDTNEELVQETALGDMMKVAAQLAEGEWGVVRGGSGLGSIDRKVISLVRGQVKASDEKRYKNAEESERVEMCREYIEALSDTQREAYYKHAAQLIERDKADAEALKALTLAVEV